MSNILSKIHSLKTFFFEKSLKSYLCARTYTENLKIPQYNQSYKILGVSCFCISHQSTGKFVKAKEILRRTYEIQ